MLKRLDIFALNQQLLDHTDSFAKHLCIALYQLEHNLYEVRIWYHCLS